MSMFSVVSKNCLPSAPALWIAIASTPGSGPRPKATTKISANTTSGTVRQNSSKRRAANTVTAARRQVGRGEEVQREGGDARPVSVPT